MKNLYYLIPVLLFIFQAIYTFNSMGQIRYEELANAVRNPFWLSQRLVYDGVSAAVGWDGVMLLIYNLFGFNLFTGKFFRLFLSFVSGVCLALTLKKYLGEKRAWLPLLVIGLSPTLLFYTSLQAQYGIDLQYLPLVYYLLTHSRWWLNLIGAFLAMVAWLSYSPFIFYLPSLLILYWLKLRSYNNYNSYKQSLRSKDLKNYKSYILVATAFLFPLFISLLYITNREIFLNDPNTGSGVFRGGGRFSLESAATNLGGLFNDLFHKGQSYHFNLYWGEFSLIFPVVVLAVVFFLSFRLLKYNGYILSSNYKIYIWLVLTSLLATLVFSSMTFDPSGAPGIRRYTPVLAAFYTLFVIAWQIAVEKWEVGSGKWDKEVRGGKVILVGVLSLLLIHHLIVYPINLVHLKDPSLDTYPIFFNTAETPAKSLQNLLDTVQKEDLKLVCLDKDKQPFYCRLSEAYAAVAGSCKWNHLDCHQILGWDHLTGDFIPLSTKLWNEYYFEH